MEPRATGILTSNGRGVTCLVQQFIGFWTNHDIVIRMFENLKGRIHLAKENGDGLSSLIKF